MQKIPSGGINIYIGGRSYGVSRRKKHRKISRKKKHRKPRHEKSISKYMKQLEGL